MCWNWSLSYVMSVSVFSMILILMIVVVLGILMSLMFERISMNVNVVWRVCFGMWMERCDLISMFGIELMRS